MQVLNNPVLILDKYATMPWQIDEMWNVFCKENNYESQIYRTHNSVKKGQKKVEMSELYETHFKHVFQTFLHSSKNILTCVCAVDCDYAKNTYSIEKSGTLNNFFPRSFYINSYIFLEDINRSFTGNMSMWKWRWIYIEME